MRLIALVIMIPLAIGGALWWYFEVHRSAVYVRAVIPLWGEMEALDTQPEFSVSSLQDDRDYQGALEVLQRRRAHLELMRERLATLKPTGRTKQMHKDFRFLLDGYLAATADAEQKAKFLTNTKDLRMLLAGQPSGGPSLGEARLPGGVNTVSDVVRLLEDQVPQLRGVGEGLFKEGLSRLLPDISLDKLFTSWHETEPILNAVLPLVRGLNQDLPASQFLQFFQSSNGQTELEQMNRFLEEAESVARATTAREILTYRSFEGAGGVTKEGLDLRAQRLGAEIEELKKKYLSPP